jgi:hypothetical protein
MPVQDRTWAAARLDVHHLSMRECISPILGTGLSSLGNSLHLFGVKGQFAAFATSRWDISICKLYSLFRVEVLVLVLVL